MTNQLVFFLHFLVEKQDVFEERLENQEETVFLLFGASLVVC